MVVVVVLGEVVLPSSSARPRASRRGVRALTESIELPAVLWVDLLVLLHLILGLILLLQLLRLLVAVVE